MPPVQASNERLVGASAHRASTIRLLRIAMVAALVVPAALFIVASWISYRNTYALADERIERSIEVVQEQALKVLQSVNLAFVAVGDLLDQRSSAEIREQASDLNRRVKGIAEALPEVQAIKVLDADGRTELTTATRFAAVAESFANEVCTVNSGVERMRTSRCRLLSGDLGSGIRVGDDACAKTNCKSLEGICAKRVTVMFPVKFALSQVPARCSS